MSLKSGASSMLRCWTILVCVMAAGPQLFAQAPGTETVQQRISISGLRAPVPNLTPGEHNLGEIKVVQEYPKPEMFTFDMAQEFFNTDNVFYTHNNTQGSTAYFASYTGSLVPYSLRDWTPRITAQYNMTRYGTEPVADFDNEKLDFSSTYVFGQGRDYSWNSDIILSRYAQPHANDHEYYREVIYDNGVNWVFQPDKETPLFLVSNYDIAYHQASPDVIDYLSNGVTFKMAYYPTSTVVIAPYINPSSRLFLNDTYFQIYNNLYHQLDRSDLHVAAGLDVTWQPIKYFLLTTSIYHVDDFSNNSGFSFSYTIPGVAVAGELKF